MAKDEWSDLVRAEGTQGAILFASQLLGWLVREFAVVQRLGEYCWTGGSSVWHPFGAVKKERE